MGGGGHTQRADRAYTCVYTGRPINTGTDVHLFSIPKERKKQKKKKTATELTETSIADEQKKVQHGDGDDNTITSNGAKPQGCQLVQHLHTSADNAIPDTPVISTQALIAVTARESNLHVCACQRKTKTPSRANGRGLLELSSVQSIVSRLCWFVDRLRLDERVKTRTAH